MSEKDSKDSIGGLLSGAIDMHIHASPDPRLRRSVDALEAAQQAQQAEMRAIVLKSHEYPTAPLAQIINKILPGFTAIGSLALDLPVGGLNPSAVENSAKMGAKIVWMPTLDSAHDMGRKNPPREGIKITDEDNRLLPAVITVLDLIKSFDMVLATGHVSPEEAFSLVDVAGEMGIWKIIATHPLLEGLGCHLSIDEQRKIVEQGAFVELCIAEMITQDGLDPAEFVEVIRTVGAEHCILSSDLGQFQNPPPVQGLQTGIARLLESGITEREIALMMKTNPAKLLGLV